MTDYETNSSSNLYWHDKIEGPESTFAAIFITAIVVGISVAAAAGVFETFITLFA